MNPLQPYAQIFVQKYDCFCVFVKWNLSQSFEEKRLETSRISIFLYICINTEMPIVEYRDFY